MAGTSSGTFTNIGDLSLYDEWRVNDWLSIVKVDGGYLYTHYGNGRVVATQFIDDDTAGGGGNSGGLRERVIVQDVSDFGAVIDSSKEYFLDGIIDMGTTSLEIPVGGIYLSGYNFDLSGLTSSEDNYTMFTSPVGGSGNIIMKTLFLSASGSGSQVFDVTSNTGFEAIEIQAVNFNSCSKIGEITDYRQWFETGSGRFGGSPSLVCNGTMNGIFFRDTILRISDPSWAGYLFEEGLSLTFSGRFTSNANVDFGPLSGFSDFRDSNFSNPSAFQLDGCLISRGGIYDPMDANLFPNISPSDLSAFWKNNIGVENTYVGGTKTLTTSAVTTINTAGTFEEVAGTFTLSDGQHFDSPVNGQLRHVGDSPREFQIIVYAIIEGGANDEIALKVVKFDDSSSTDSDVVTQTRSIINVVGGTDVAIYQINSFVSLDRNDYVRLQVANNTDTTDVEMLTDSYFIIKER